MSAPRKTPRPRGLAVLSKWRIGLMLFGLLAVIALTVDLATLSLRTERALKKDGLSSHVAGTLIEISTATNRWRDPVGRFSLALPGGWAATGEEPEVYDVTLRGPYGLEIGVAVRPAEAGGMEALGQRLREIEARLNLTTRMEEDVFQGRPAWRRTMPLQKSTLETIDCLAGEHAVHVVISAPPEIFADFRPALVELRDSLALEKNAAAGRGGNP